MVLGIDFHIFLSFSILHVHSPLLCAMYLWTFLFSCPVGSSWARLRVWCVDILMVCPI